jgi:SRSO17 transposase
VGKLDNGIVTVHVGVAKGPFQALLDAELYLPKSWDQDRPRCRAAGIPDEVRYRPKWRIALDQLVRLGRNGLCFDWLVFDEGYGASVPFLEVLGIVGQRFVAEVPVNFAVRDGADGLAQRADERLTGADAQGGRRYRLAHRTVADSVWRAASAAVWVAGREHTLIAAVHEGTGEVKYFLTNATAEPVARVLAVAFRRWTVEHGFRLGKQEAGLMDYEGCQATIISPAQRQLEFPITPPCLPGPDDNYPSRSVRRNCRRPGGEAGDNYAAGAFGPFPPRPSPQPDDPSSLPVGRPCLAFFACSAR